MTSNVISEETLRIYREIAIDDAIEEAHNALDWSDQQIYDELIAFGGSNMTEHEKEYLAEKLDISELG